MANEKLESNKSPGADQIPVVLINVGVMTIRSEINKLINYIWNNEELPHQWKELNNEPLYRKGDKRDCSNYTGTSLLSTTLPVLLGRSTLRTADSRAKTHLHNPWDFNNGHI